MHLAYTDEANKLLETSPLALLIGMLLDQQIPMEKAFTSPAVLRERLGGTLDAATIAGYDPEELEAIFRTPPALHRFPAAMAKRVQTMCQILVERYDGDAAAVWSGARSGKEVVARVGALPGFGEQKAQIFTALLGKQYGVQPRAGARRPASSARRARPQRRRRRRRRVAQGGAGLQAAMKAAAKAARGLSVVRRRRSGRPQRLDLVAPARRPAPRRPTAPQPRSQLATIRCPPCVSTDSGWNCTPSIGSDSCRSAITTPDAVRPVTSISGGSSSSATASEW